MLTAYSFSRMLLTVVLVWNLLFSCPLEAMMAGWLVRLQVTCSQLLASRIAPSQYLPHALFQHFFFCLLVLGCLLLATLFAPSCCPFWPPSYWLLLLSIWCCCCLPLLWLRTGCWWASTQHSLLFYLIVSRSAGLVDYSSLLHKNKKPILLLYITIVHSLLQRPTWYYFIRIE